MNSKKLISVICVVLFGVCIFIEADTFVANDANKNIVYSSETEEASELVLDTERERKSEPGSETDDEETHVPAIMLDVIAPNFTWYEDIYVTLGDSISYLSHVAAEDESGCEVEIEVDKSRVDTLTPGTYEVYYTAYDAAGNSSSIMVYITIGSQPVYDEETVGPLCDDILASIGATGTDESSLRAIFDWCKNNISYSSKNSYVDDIWAGAYQGIKKRTGDCYISYATLAALLTRAGFDNVCVSRVGGTSNHYWALVRVDGVGDGWYHCDASARHKNYPYDCYMQTDEQLQRYTDWYTSKPNYYVFDTSAYPARGTTPVYDGGMGL